MQPKRGDQNFEALRQDKTKIPLPIPRDHKEATSSLDELINLGRKEAFAEVILLLYALKRAI